MATDARQAYAELPPFWQAVVRAHLSYTPLSHVTDSELARAIEAATLVEEEHLPDDDGDREYDAAAVGEGRWQR